MARLREIIIDKYIEFYKFESFDKKSYIAGAIAAIEEFTMFGIDSIDGVKYLGLCEICGTPMIGGASVHKDLRDSAMEYECDPYCHDCYEENKEELLKYEKMVFLPEIRDYVDDLWFTFLGFDILPKSSGIDYRSYAGGLHYSPCGSTENEGICDCNLCKKVKEYLMPR